MASRLSALFRILGSNWPAAAPLPTLNEELGVDVVVQAQRLGLSRRSALEAGGVYPCRSFCSMRLIDDDGLIAVCEHSPPRCRDIRVAQDEAFLVELDVDTVAPALQRLLGLEPVPYGGDAIKVALGARRLGARWMRFVLVPRPRFAIEIGYIDRVVREDPDRDLVVVTFTESLIPANAPRRIDGVRVQWVGLDAAVTDDGAIDLSDVWRPSGNQPLFVVDESRGEFSYADLRLPVDPDLLPGKLLLTLLRRPGVWLPRRDLLLALWPNDLSGRKKIDLPKLDRRLRDTTNALREVFRQIEVPEGVLANPIATRYNRSDTEGAYRVVVEPDRVRFV